jgi:DNA-binding response OmpR family regulator
MTSPFSKPPSVGPPSIAPDIGRKRILVIDDDEGTRTAIMRLLFIDYDVTVAADGIEGIQRATDSPAPDLIITDVWMPRLDGVEMVKRMKRIPSLARTPVIFLTGQTSTESVVAGISSGARHYLAKPVDPDELETKVRKALGGPK